MIKIDNISVRCKNNIKSVHSNNITYELNKFIKLKTVSETRIIINKKVNSQAINITHELINLKKV